MASQTPSPGSSPSVIQVSTPPPSTPNSTTNSPPPSTSQPGQTTNPPLPSTPSNPATPPPQSPPPAQPAASPPAPPPSPPPPPPPIIPSTPPPSAPPPSPPPSPTPPPPALTPPSPPAAPPPASTISPPPPPLASPTTPVTSPPHPQAVSPSPPPPADNPTPPATNSPPPPSESPPTVPPPSSQSDSPPPSTNSPPPPSESPPTVPPSSQSDSPPPSTNSPPPPISTLPTPPPSIPSNSSTPPAISPPAPPVNSSVTGSPTSPFPAIPTEKPTARATNGSDVSTNTSSTGSGSLNSGGAVTVGVVVGFVVLGLLVMAVWFAQKRKRRRENVGYTMPSPFASSQNSDSVFLKPYPPAPLVGSPSGSDFMYSPSEPGVVNSRSWFTYDELFQATNGFSIQNRLGEGGFGCVYKGVLVDGRDVAVKQLKIGGSQGEREFRAEVEIISRVHHRHLVSLVGYCISEHQRLLVYDFLPNDTLDHHLHGEGRPFMDWATRVRVAAGAARGIAYLHEDCHPRIIHRDIKSSNILLDENFEAQVSDFGLAKIAQELDSNTHVSTRVMGTFGYMAPEYATSGKLTEKSDVYSFGVVLLELITGRKPVDASQPLGDESLVEWARPLLTDAIENEDFEALLSDSGLEKNYVPSEMFRMIEAAAACVRHSAAKRPRMSQVVRALDSLDESSDLSNGMRPGQSEIFDSRQHSAQIRMFQRMAFGNQDYNSEFFDRTQSSWSSDRGDHV